MTNVLNRLALASQRAPGLRSFELLGDRDVPRLHAFFLSFDFDQRRAYFGGGISDHAVSEYCRAIDWDTTTVIARSGPYCLEAVATLVSLPPEHEAAEFSVGCPLACDQRPIIGELFNLAIEIAAVRHRVLLVRRELANGDLLALLRGNDHARFDDDSVELDLVEARRLTAAC